MIKLKIFYLFGFILINCIVQNGAEDMALFLTVSADGGHLQVSWSNMEIDDKAVLVITNREPIENDNYRKISCFHKTEKKFHNNTGFRCDIPVKEKTSFVKTRIPYDLSLQKSLGVETWCYGYWVQFINRDGIKITSCIAAHPIWMNRMRPNIGGFWFRHLFIPGTHDSGSYQITNTILPTVKNFALTQHDDIYTQLMHGIRYLDIRVGYYPDDSKHKFWINHSTYKMLPLIDAIEQVKKFIYLTNEIVIFDIQEFPVGFGKTLEVHSKLVDFVQNEFNELMVDPTLVNEWEATLEDIWATNGRVIVSYDEPNVYNNDNRLFWSVQQRWGDVYQSLELEKYLTNVTDGKYDDYASRPFAAMAELTPTVGYIASHLGGSLRYMADKINLKVSKLYFEKLNEKANVVALDFYRGTYIVEAALIENFKRAGLY